MYSSSKVQRIKESFFWSLLKQKRNHSNKGDDVKYKIKHESRKDFW